MTKSIKSFRSKSKRSRKSYRNPYFDDSDQTESESNIEKQKIIEAKKEDTRKWFESIFTGDKEVTKRQFVKLYKQVEDFSTHFFRLFDTNDSGDLSLEEIQAGLNKLSNYGEAKKNTIKWFTAQFKKHTPPGQEIDETVFLNSINKEFLAHLFDLLDIDKSGTISTTEFHRSVNRMLMMGAEEKVIAYLETKFHECSSDPEHITYKEFSKVIHNKQEYFTKKMFEICDKDKSNSISLQEFVDTLGKLMKTSSDPKEKEKIKRDKLLFLFRIYDADANGEISRSEMRKCMEMCMLESNLDIDDTNTIADMLFETVDLDNSGGISFQEFYVTMKTITDNLDINPKGWVLPARSRKGPSTLDKMAKYFQAKYIRNNIVIISNILVILLLFLASFIYGLVKYRSTYPALMVAKGAGKCLDLCSVLLFLSMCRKTLTTIRNSPLGRIIALDQVVDVHKALGIVYGVFALTHTIAHVFTFLENKKLEKEKTGSNSYKFVLEAGGYFGGSYISGVILVIALIILLIFAHTKVRRGGHFTVFYWVHFTCYWLLVIGTILHCEHFWKWMVAPLVLYIIEKIISSNLIEKAIYGRFFIIDYKLLPSKVVELKISRPSTFNYHAGSYVFMTIPHITPYEKHPFTISSSAENKNHLTFHIKMQQGWTKKLHEVMNNDNLAKIRNSKESKLSEAYQIERETDIKKYPWLNNFGMLRRRQLKVHIDGPYGAPATEIFNSEHAVLIAAGIGVTPFASILQTIIDKYEQSCCICARCGNWNDHGTFNTKINKLDFVWVTRDQKSLEWFIDVLKNLEVAMDKFTQNRVVDEPKLKNENSKFFVPIDEDTVTSFSPPESQDNSKSEGTEKSNWYIQDDSKNNKSETYANKAALDNTENEEKSKTMRTRMPSLPRDSSIRRVLDRLNSSVSSDGTPHKFLDLHIYLTSALSKRDFRAVGLQYALQLSRNKTKTDKITGLKSPTQAGRPDWTSLFDKFQAMNQGKMTVFFCGAPVIEKQLKKQCDLRRIKFKSEKF